MKKMRNRKAIMLIAIVILIICVVGINHFISPAISIFTEKEIKKGYYIIVSESSCDMSLQRIFSDDEEIQELVSILSNLEYTRKKRIDPAGGYSIIISLFDGQNIIKTVTILSEKKTVVCMDNMMYYLKSDQLNIDNLKKLLSEDN